VDDLKEAKWYIDASHNVHWDCKGQTGGGMTLGKGACLSGSNKQKTNSKSACETDLIGVDDYIFLVLWSLYFIQAQGIDMSNARIYQDNKSTILLENNGKMSSSKRTKHIKSKFFFITDRIHQGEVVVEYLPTEEMWIDVNTKPKQGYPFRRDRAMLMNCPVDLPDETLIRSPDDVSRGTRLQAKITGQTACSDTSRKVTFSDGLTAGKKLLDTPNNPVNTNRTASDVRLQECVGRSASSEFQVEPKPLRGTRRGHKSWRSMAPAITVA
jgi:hypothetical protein